jgi:hypothetical protein
MRTNGLVSHHGSSMDIGGYGRDGNGVTGASDIAPGHAGSIEPHRTKSPHGVPGVRPNKSPRLPSGCTLRPPGSPRVSLSGHDPVC